jgi:hypothetical protein
MATLHLSSGQPLVPTVAASRRKVIKGTTFDPNFVQLREEGAQELLAEALIERTDCAANFLSASPAAKIEAFRTQNNLVKTLYVLTICEPTAPQAAPDGERESAM